MNKFVEKVFGTYSENELEKLNPIVKKINSRHLRKMKHLSDSELKEKTGEFITRLQNGETLDDVLVDAYAAVKEACFRVLGLLAYNVQLLGAIVIHQGRIAQMKTGEGKTLTSVFPAYLNALSKKGVHIATVNEYLAVRDSDEMGEVFKFMGLTVGCIKNSMQSNERKLQYDCDITYSTHSELGFDYLRDNMVKSIGERVQRGLNFVIIDEADSILIDEARTPLIISSMGTAVSNHLYYIDEIVKKMEEDVHFEISEKDKTIYLTEKGINFCEEQFKLINIMDIRNAETYHRINQALRANFIMHKDVDYVVAPNDKGEDEIVIVDQHTGRLMFGRRYVDGLHHAIEAKEKVTIQRHNKTVATITYQNLFRMYGKMSGMTGTGIEADSEFKKVYSIDVIEIPTNKPTLRQDCDDLLFKSEEAKFQAVLKDIETRHEKGQPILVGTESVEKSEMLSGMLKKRKIPHNVLNAKNFKEEAEIIKLSGQKGAVTISTNMAGRGVDIKLGEGVLELGGLHVIGTTRHESQRIDNQLRGRSGRQGDVGSSIFYVSFEDDLLKRFAPDKILDRLEEMDYGDDDYIEDKKLTRAITNAQKLVEAENLNIRKRLLEFDEVLNIQRGIIYEQRNKILENNDIREVITDMIEDCIDDIVLKYCNDESKEKWNIRGYILEIGKIFRYDRPLMLENLDKMTSNDLSEKTLEQVSILYEEKEAQFEGDLRQLERQAFLTAIDINWVEYLEAIDEIKDGIWLRGLGNYQPIVEYKLEASKMFDGLIANIRQYTIRIIWRYLQEF